MDGGGAPTRGADDLPLLHASHVIAALPKHIDDRILARQVTRADGDHDCSGLGHALLDPTAPIGIAALDQRLLEIGRGAKIAIEAARDGVDVAARPSAEHLAEFTAE